MLTAAGQDITASLGTEPTEMTYTAFWGQFDIFFGGLEQSSDYLGIRKCKYSKEIG